MPWVPLRPAFPWRTLAKVVLPIVALVVVVQVGSFVVEQRSPVQRARKLKERAQLHWQVGQLDEAAQGLEEARALQPDDGQVTVLLARLRQSQGRFDDAEQLLRDALTRRPQDPLLAVPLARLLLDTGRPLDAAEVLAPELGAIRKITDPVQRIDALLVAARAATGLGSLLEAEALLREAMRVGPAPVTSVAKAAAEACLALADLFTRSGRLPAAREALDAARTYTPWDPRIALGRARIFELAGQTDEAVAQLEPLVAAPAGPGLTAAAALGDVLLRAKRAGDVAVLASRVEGTVAGRELAGALRAAAALGGDDPEQAMAEATRFADSHPRSPSAQLARARAAIATGALPVAREAFGLALAKEPGLTEAALGLLEVDERAGDQVAIRTRALGLLEQPEARAWGLRALVSLSLRDPSALSAARERVEALVAARPRDVRLRVLLGLVRLGDGQLEHIAEDLQPLLTAADLPSAMSTLADSPEGMLQSVLAVEGLAVLMLRPAHAGNPAGRLVAARALERLDRVALASALLGESDGALGHEGALLRVQLAIRSGAIDQAVAALDALRGREPDDAGILAALGELRLLNGDFAQAREILEQAARTTPGSAAIRARLGRARAGTGDLAGATEAYAAARAIDRSLAVAHEDAVLPLGAGDAQAASARLREAHDATGDPRVGFALVATEAGAGRPREALQTLHRMDQPIDMVDAHLLVACLMAESGEPEAARATARAGPATPRAVQQAVTQRSEGAARRDLWTLVALGALEWWGQAHACAQAIVTDPRADALSLWWAWRAFERRDRALAVRLGERLAALTPEDEELTLHLAVARAATGDATGDANLVRPLYQAGLKNPRLLVELGMALERVGDPRAAEACYRDAGARGLTDAMASNNLAWILSAGPTEERRREGLIHAREAVRLAPTSAEALDTLAWVHHLLGDDHDALPIIERAAARLPGNATVRFHAGEILAALGRVDEARLTLEAALQLPGAWPEAPLARARLEALGTVTR